MEKLLTFESLPKAVNQLNAKLENIERLLTEKNEKQPKGQLEQLLSIDEAAILLHLTKATLYSKVSNGELPFMKKSKRLYFLRTELMEYIKAGRKKTNAEIEAEANTYLKKKGGLND